MYIYGYVYTYIHIGTEEVKAAVKSPSAYPIHVKKDKVFHKDKDQHIGKYQLSLYLPFLCNYFHLYLSV
jgi:hypothetical protein